MLKASPQKTKKRTRDDTADASKPTKKTRKRPDRAKKLTERKELIETVVKCSLRNALIGTPDEKSKLVQAVEARVTAYSHRVVLATRALNLLIRQLFANVSDLQHFTVDVKFTDQTFLRQLLLGTEGADVDRRISEVFRTHPELLYNVGDRHLSDRNIYSDAAIALGANIRTHLKVNLMKVVKKAVYQCSTGTDEAKREMLFRICGWNINPKKQSKPKTTKLKLPQEVPLSAPSLSEEHLAFVATCRGVLGLGIVKDLRSSTNCWSQPWTTKWLTRQR